MKKFTEDVVALAQTHQSQRWLAISIRSANEMQLVRTPRFALEQATGAVLMAPVEDEEDDGTQQRAQVSGLDAPPLSSMFHSVEQFVEHFAVVNRIRETSWNHFVFTGEVDPVLVFDIKTWTHLGNKQYSGQLFRSRMLITGEKTHREIGEDVVQHLHVLIREASALQLHTPPPCKRRREDEHRE